MAINVLRPYKLGKKKEVIEAWAYGELKSSEAARSFGVRKQNFPTIPSNILRHMVMSDPAFAKAFSKQLKNY